MRLLRSRRQLIQVGSLGLTGLTLPTWLAAASPRTHVAGSVSAAAPRATADHCLLIYLDGGSSHIDLLDLKPDAPAEIRGPYRPIATSVPGIEIGELLPRLAQQMHEVCLLRSVRHTEMVHDPAVYQMLTGYKHISSAGGLKVEETDLPHIASAVQCAFTQPSIMPGAIELPETMHMEGRILPGQNGGILGSTFDPLRIGVTAEGEVRSPSFSRQPEIGDSRLAQRRGLLEQLRHERSQLEYTPLLERFDRFQQQALEIISQPSIDRAFDLSAEAPALRDLYGRHRHGQSVLLARRLIEAGARFVTVYWGREQQDWADGKGPRFANNPWDTHRNHFPIVERDLAPRADQTLAALLSDLRERGLLERTLVVWMGDFGRTPRISKPWASRDHWPHAFSMIMAGGGMQPGQVYGATDRTAEQITDRPLSPADLTATICHCLGLDPALRFPIREGSFHQLSTGMVISKLVR